MKRYLEILNVNDAIVEHVWKYAIIWVVNVIWVTYEKILRNLKCEWRNRIARMKICNNISAKSNSGWSRHVQVAISLSTWTTPFDYVHNLRNMDDQIESSLNSENFNTHVTYPRGLDLAIRLWYLSKIPGAG